MGKKRVLITGVTGFVASHLVEFLAKRDDIEIFGTKRWRSPLDNIKGFVDMIEMVDCELRDLISVKDAIEKVKPDVIFHLAAQSFVPAGISQPHNTMVVNTIGTLNLLEAVRFSHVDPIIHFASTADVYGEMEPSFKDIDERTLPRPPNLYAVSKLSAEYICYQYFSSYGIRVVVTRMLTHTGPRRGENFVESSFAKQIALIELGHSDRKIRVGNLRSIRTFLDIRDAVRAYWMLVNMGKTGECYNICGDVSVPIQVVLDTLLSFCEIRDKISIEIDQKLFRPNDPMRPKISIKKFTDATGWKPEIPFSTTMSDLLNFWREKCKNGK